MCAASIRTIDIVKRCIWIIDFHSAPRGEAVSFHYISFLCRRLISSDCFHKVSSAKSPCQDILGDEPIVGSHQATCEWIKWEKQHFVNHRVWFSLATELTSFQWWDLALIALVHKDIKILCFGHFASLKNCKLSKEVRTKLRAKIVLLISWGSNFIEHLIIFINMNWLLGTTATY